MKPITISASLPVRKNGLDTLISSLTELGCHVYGFKAGEENAAEPNFPPLLKKQIGRIPSEVEVDLKKIWLLAGFCISIKAINIFESAMYAKDQVFEPKKNTYPRIGSRCPVIKKTNQTTIVL
jgi:hypothetical protein